MLISIINKTSLKIEEKKVKKIVDTFLKKEKIKTDEITVYFVDEKTIKNLHKRFFNDPSSTDCISLPFDKPNQKNIYHVLGEIFICPDVAKKNAKEFKTSLCDEITLYIIHSLLHLIGYDDINEKDIQKIRKKEKEISLYMKKKNISL